MKIHIDKKYLKISVYAALTFAFIYVIKLAVDAVAFSLTNLGEMAEKFKNLGATVMSLFSLPLMAFIVAYLLDPVCDFFQKLCEKKFKIKSGRRTVGTAVTYIVIIAVLGLLFLIAGLYIGNGMPISQYINTAMVQLKQMYNNFSAFLVRHSLDDYIMKYINVIWGYVLGSFNNLGNNIIDSVTGIGSFVLDLALSFVIAFYFLTDKDKFLGSAKTILKIILPKRVYGFLRKTALDCDYVFSGYIRGQLTDAVIMSVLISAFLTIARIRFGIVIGIISGFSNIIPYFGAIVGFLLAVLSALLSGEPIKAVYGAAIMIVLQQIDSAVISPKVVGKKVALSPPLVIIALAIGGRLFGLWGMILAVPVCGLIKMIIVGRYNQYLEKKKNPEKFEEKKSPKTD